MRVSCFILLICVLARLAFSDATPPAFDQMTWNIGMQKIIQGIWISEFGANFTPSYFAANVTRENRIASQCHRLRARVGLRLAESLDDSQIICQQEHFSPEAFLQIEKELIQKGWDAHWIAKTLVDECGSQSKGFLYVKLKK